jgi:hypothetical protein
MPAAKRYQTPGSSEARQQEDDYVRERNERRAAMIESWNYYNGQHRLPLKPDKTRADDNVILNLVGLAVDKSVAGILGTDDRGMLRGVEFEVVDEAGEPGFRGLFRRARAAFAAERENPAQTYLDAVWSANRSNRWLANVMTTGAITGHVFVKVLPESYEQPGIGMLPRLVNLNPANVGVYWDADDRERALWYRIEYGNTRQDIVRAVSESDGDLGYWWIMRYSRKTEGGRWEQAQEPEQWPYSWAPVVDWPNRAPSGWEFYGRDDLGGAGRVNDQINFVLSNVQRIIKYHAHPRTIVTGARLDDIKDTSINAVWSIPAPDAKVENLEMQSDLGSSMALYSALRRAFFDELQELDPGSVQDHLGQITNFGLRVLYNDTLAKYGAKRMVYGEALKRLCGLLFALAGLPAETPVNVRWPDPLPNDPLQEAQALQIDALHGMSNETYLERRGYEPEQERQRREIQRGERVEDESVIAQARGLEALVNRGRELRDIG